MATPTAASPQPDDLALLIVQHRDDAYRLARRLVRTSVEAEDLTQTAILNTLRRAEHISDPQHVRAYLLTAVRNLWRNQLRERSRRRFIGEDIAEQLPSDELDPAEQALTVLDTALAAAALASLSARSQEIITMRYIDELAYEDVAQRLGISPVAARQRAHRARDELIGACIDCAAQSGHGGCSSVRVRLGRYYRGRLTRRIRGQIATHLERCDACSACYEELVDMYGRPALRQDEESG